MRDDEQAKRIALKHYRGWIAHDTKEDSLEVAELAYEITAAFAVIREECAKESDVLKWTPEKPWKAGWYWRKGPTGYIEIVEIYCERDQCWIRGGTDYNVLSVLGEWAGPIEPPK
jgi:hypothetical protein